MMKGHKAILVSNNNQMSMQYRNGATSLEIDSEALYNTVSELVERESSEIAPFVLMWHPLLTQLGSGVSTNQVASSINSALNEVLKRSVSFATNTRTNRGGFSPQNFSEASTTANLVSQMSNGKSIDREILQQMERLVLNAVAVNETTNVSYLEPITEIAARQGCLAIGTLNYDTSVEELCGRTGVRWSDGIPNEEDLAEDDDRTLTFQQSGINLYKLHGSTSWRRIISSKSVVHPKDDSAGRLNVVRFGGRNKLSADWPFLDIFWKWQEEIRSVDTLWIIGYSFRDAHINAVIEAWFRANKARRVVIVDPGFDNQMFNQNPLGEAINLLSTDVLGRPTIQSPRSGIPPNLTNEDVRVAIVRAGTGESLRPMVDAYPNLPIEYALSTRPRRPWES